MSISNRLHLVTIISITICLLVTLVLSNPGVERRALFRDHGQGARPTHISVEEREKKCSLMEDSRCPFELMSHGKGAHKHTWRQESLIK